MSAIQKTSDYTIFKKHPSNRPPDGPNLKKLTNSIRVRNLLEFRPILVDSEMRIIDGQHRLEVAKLLGLEIYYQIQSDCTHEDIVLLNSNQKNWTIDNYVDYYVSLGNKEYLKLKEFCEKRKISVNLYTKMMTNGSSHEKYATLRTGGFKFMTSDEMIEFDDIMRKVSETIRLLQALLLSNKGFIATARFRGALHRFLGSPECDFNVFLNKIRIKCDALKVCADNYSYYCMLRDIYNWKNQAPIG